MNTSPLLQVGHLIARIEYSIPGTVERLALQVMLINDAQRMAGIVVLHAGNKARFSIPWY
jgi:hypothetical protein